jgi:hypothetical protein
MARRPHDGGAGLEIEDNPSKIDQLGAKERSIR